MRISELILELQKKYEWNGDLQVYIVSKSPKNGFLLDPSEVKVEPTGPNGSNSIVIIAKE